MSERFPGGIISKTAPVPTGPYENGTAPGIWTLEQQAEFVRQGIWPIAGNVPNYIEDVFQTWLYTGNGSSQTITNGIDLAGKGGLVWVKARSAATDNALFDTARGAGEYLSSNRTDAQFSSSGVTAFNSNGFGISGSTSVNGNGVSLASWTFREQPKFFDVVTYTGNGAAGQAINHNLGSVPGFVVVKRINTTGDWAVYHRSLGATQVCFLNDSQAAGTTVQAWNNTEPTSTQFTVGVGYNASGSTYVAYLFAHNAGGFGLSGNDNVISCGSYSGTGGPVEVTLGYEPQWILFKAATAADNWRINDIFRGIPTGGATANLAADLPNAEYGTNNRANVTATGFIADASNSQAGVTHTYVAIRRGPMAVPTVGTSVFSPVARTGTNTTTSITAPGFPPDMLLQARRSAPDWPMSDRLRGVGQNLAPCYLSAENTPSPAYVESYDMTGATIGNANAVNGGGLTYIDYFFRRAPRFFDEVCYTGNGTSLVLNHNLTIAPELIIGKRRTGSSYWILAGNFGVSSYFCVNDWGGNSSSTNTSYSGGLSFGARPTATTITLDNNSALNVSGFNGVLWMWATCPGVSKVGVYTGTGATQTIDCGFTGGTRFALITRVGVAGVQNVYVWDSARGIVAGNDPYLAINSTAGEVTNTDWVDTAATGFELSNAGGNLVNVNGGTYIFLAIA